MRKAVRWLGRFACDLVSFLGTVQSTPLMVPVPALLGDTAVSRGLEKPAQSFLDLMLSGEAGLHDDSVLLKPPEARASEAPFGKPPGGGVAGLDAKVLEVRDHSRDRPFDQGPTFGRLLQLAPSDLPEAAVLVGHGLREEELVQSAPVLQDHRPERVAAIAFP